MPQQNKTAIVFGDVHFPHHDPKAISVLEKVMGAQKWDHWVCIGDLLDFDCISRHNVSKADLRSLEGKRLMNDYLGVNELLDRQQKLIRKRNPNAEFVYLEGNHEQWLDRLIDAQPVLEGIIEVPVQLKLKERNIKWIPRADNKNIHKIGNARFIHGHYVGNSHPRKHAQVYGTNLFYGHLHDVCSHSLTVKGNDKEVVAQSIGCLCSKDLKYKKGSPDNWNLAFMTMEFLPNGNFHYQIHRIFNGQTVFNGKVYTA